MYIKNGLYTTWKGMNLTRSRRTPTSRYSRITEYLRVNGPSTKSQVLYDVFGKTVRNSPGIGLLNRTPDSVTRGWGTYVWNLMVKNNDVKMTRVGNRVYYSV